MWTDGRYFVQANMEMDCNWTLMKEGMTTYRNRGNETLQLRASSYALQVTRFK